MKKCTPLRRELEPPGLEVTAFEDKSDSKSTKTLNRQRDALIMNEGRKMLAKRNKIKKAMRKLIGKKTQNPKSRSRRCHAAAPQEHYNSKVRMLLQR